jgi:hypothetical protein
MCSHSISSPFLLLQERLRSESMSGAEQMSFNVINSSHLFTFISHYYVKNGLYVHNTRTYVSLLRLCYKTRMLRTFIAKASSTVCVLSPQERHCIEALTCKLKIRFQFTNEQRPPERWQMTWKRHLPSSTTCCHMINKKKLVSSHHSSPQTWQSLPPKVFQMYLWWRHCCHTFE